MNAFIKRIKRASDRAKEIYDNNITVIYRDGHTAVLPPEYVIAALVKEDCGGIVDVRGCTPIVRLIAGIIRESVQ